MFRGNRWQFLALIVSVVLFGVGLVARFSSQPQVVAPTVTFMATLETVSVTSTPEATLTPAQIATITSPLPPSDTGDIITYREALVGRVQRLNPVFGGLNPVDTDIVALIFEGLTRVDEYGAAVPRLAKDWVISNDGLEYVVLLRNDVKWQDGVLFSADDVVYTMSILSAPDFPGPEEVGAFWRTVETEKIDDYTVRFRLSQPLSSFLVHLTIGILPYHALQGTTAEQLASHPFNLTPIGTGPYQLESLHATGDSSIDVVDLRVSPTFRERPEGQMSYSMNRVRFRLYDSYDLAVEALKGGDVDGLAARDRYERQSLLNLPTVTVYNSIEPTLGILIYNWDEGDNRFFQDQRVRAALLTGLNRITPVENALSNLAVYADSPLIVGSWAYQADLPWPQYNQTAALKFLSRANIRIAASDNVEVEGATATPGPPPTGGALYIFTILTVNDPALTNLAQAIATQWSQLNLSVSVESVDFATFWARMGDGDFDAAIVELPIGADPDTYSYWHSGQYPDGKNYGGMADDRISEALERARRDVNGINRAQLYAQFQNDFIVRGVAIPLYYPLYSYGVRADIDGVQLGFIGSPTDRFRTLGAWTPGD